MGIGGTWYWYAPLMEPLVKYVSRVQSQQVTFLTQLFGLNIPECLGKEAAVFLHRVRRRTVLQVLAHEPEKQWVAIWCKRKWSYLGHVLRMKESALVRQEVLSMSSLKQAHPGPLHHILRWGCTTSGRDTAALTALAQDREAWIADFDSRKQAFLHVHPVLHAISTNRWRDVFRLEVPWRLGVFVRCVGDAYSIHWLHVSEGFQTFSRTGTLEHVIITWVQWIQLEFLGLLLDFHMHEDLLQSQGDVLLELHDSIYSSHRYVCSFNSVPPRIARKMISLVQHSD